MIKTAICDDETKTRSYLSALIQAQPCSCEIIEYASADDCLADGCGMDLLFLDIELGRSGSGQDGMALAQKIREQDLAAQPVIIFVTGYDQYVFDAFDVGAFQYIYYIESSNHKVVLHLKDGEFACYAKIRDLESELQEQFFRIHKGYLVNLSYVCGYSKSEVTLTNEEKLLLSKYKYQDFVKTYLRFLKKGMDL